MLVVLKFSSGVGVVQRVRVVVVFRVLVVSVVGGRYRGTQVVRW